MTTTIISRRLLPAILLISPAFLQAQVPVDEDGRVIGQASSGADIMLLGEGDIPRLSDFELQELVGPVALYPDDLLAVVLPASAYPLQIAAAARFLDARQDDPTLEPNPEWDDAVVALLNYPEVLELMNDDLDWTYRLGEAVVAQQSDVVAAVEAFRDRVYAAGNLTSDEYQTIERADDVIRITPVSDDVIYVPYYEPERVLVYQPRPVYYYYPRPCPVYYYPYSSGYQFDRGYFWGVTTAFTLGWRSDSLHVYHHSYRGHPYYGRHYRDNWWYRRPSINIHNTTYITNTNRTTNVHVARTVDYDRGDRWHPRSDRREYIVGEGYSNRTRGRTSDSVATTRKRTGGSVATRSTRQPPAVRSRQPDAITFRDRTLNEDRRESRQGRRTDQTSRPATVRAGSTRTKSGSVSERRYVTPKTEARVPTSRRTESRRQEPVRSVREEPARTSRQSRVVRPEPARTVRPEPSRTARPEPSRRETTRRESSRPARQERAAPQRESRPSRSEPSRRESRDRSSRQKRK